MEASAGDLCAGNDRLVAGGVFGGDVAGFVAEATTGARTF